MLIQINPLCKFICIKRHLQEGVLNSDMQIEIIASAN